MFPRRFPGRSAAFLGRGGQHVFHRSIEILTDRLTPRGVLMPDDATPESSPESTAPVTRKSGRIPEYARNQTDLGRYLMPPRDRKIIQLAMKRDGCPGRTPDGRYHIGEWQEFVNRNFASANPEASPDKFKLEMEKLRLQNEKLQFELQVKRKDYTANSDIEVWVGELVMSAKRVLLAIPGKLAPQVVGLTEVEAERRMREEINLALEQLTARPLNA